MMLFTLFVTLLVGLFLSETLTIPVEGASSNDWHDQTFWYEPWGSSGVHKGIDIFGEKGTAVIAASAGVVVFSGEIRKGGNVIAILGPKWRIHYYAHLESITVSAGRWVSKGGSIGTLGGSGNAADKPPHLHYAIISLLPYFWLISDETQGWKKMFYLNPDVKLR